MSVSRRFYHLTDNELTINNEQVKICTFLHLLNVSDRYSEGAKDLNSGIYVKRGAMIILLIRSS